MTAPTHLPSAHTADNVDPVAVDPATVEFVLELMRALHGYGESAPRLEHMLGALSDQLGLPNAQFFSQPTGIQASFGPLGRQHTFLLRVEPGGVDLGKLAAVDRVALDVAQGRRTPNDGAAAIAHIAAAPPLYGPALTILALALASGSACQFLGGGRREVLVATLLGLGTGLLERFATRRPRLADVFEPLAAFLVSAAAVALAHAIGPFSVPVATLSGLIVLVPGLTLTAALSELASRHLASGTARLSGAFMTFLGIAFGVALGNHVATAALGPPPTLGSTPLPVWAGVVVLAVSPLCFTVIFRAESRDAPWIVAVGVLGVLAGRLGAATLGVELGAFAGAFAIGLASRLYARVRHRPAAVVLVPSLLLLVPGTVGFRSLTSLMDRQVLTGVATAFSAMLTAAALVAGLLLAGVLAPERRLGGKRSPITARRADVG